MITNKEQKGFTLLEILLVVAAIAILAAIVIVAINPTKQLGQTKNAQRRADVTTILNAVYQYSIDNNGAIPPSISTTTRNICKTGVSSTVCQGVAAGFGGVDVGGVGVQAGAVYLGELTTSELYLTSIPTDPSGVGTATTGYYIRKTPTNRIYVEAPHAESFDSNTVYINVTR
ncbi:MAG TPA: prepilin-type N-terminal cleavage/methylation domain-containing protein [bacterium]|nr:prepilin-type N-terminal cleavage/methylation domain-containing protein [bacterium]